jgi:Nuclease-related domain
MYPPAPGEATHSEAERILFGVIKKGLSDEWIVLHSLGLAIHPTKPWAEVDFVLVGPPGIYCLEVKGGRVTRRDGRWAFIDRHGHETIKTEGPFEQVGKASAALWDYLRGRVKIGGSLLGYGVMTPDIRFTISEPDVLLDVVYDADDVGHPISDYVTRLASYWQARMGSQRRSKPVGLDERLREAVLELLRPDFDTRLSLRARADLVSNEVVRLTAEQFRVVDGLAENPRALVIGGAGTGKTLLAVEEASRQAAEGRRVFLTCFSRRLSSYTSTLVRDPLVTVLNLHRYMVRTVESAGLSSRLGNTSLEDAMAVTYPELCYEALIQASAPPFDVLIVDEAQDLVRNLYLDVFDAALQGGLTNGLWRVFYDPRQDLFGGLEPSGMARLRALRPALFRLTVNCRNTAPIATATGMLAGYRPDETLSIEGPEVAVHWIGAREVPGHQVDATVRQLLSGGLRAEEVVVLSPRNLESSSLANRPTLGGLRLLDEEAPPEAKGIRYHTVQGFKGLESEAVLLTDLQDLRETKSLLAAYLGGSRARTFLHVFLPDSARGDYLERARVFGQVLADAPPSGDQTRSDGQRQ